MLHSVLLNTAFNIAKLQKFWPTNFEHRETGLAGFSKLGETLWLGYGVCNPGALAMDPFAFEPRGLSVWGPFEMCKTKNKK